MLPAAHLTPSFAAIRTRQSTFLEGKPGAGCISHMHGWSVFTPPQHLHIKPLYDAYYSPVSMAALYFQVMQLQKLASLSL